MTPPSAAPDECTSPSATPPAIAECAIGALVADAPLREAVLGDLAEEFAARWVQDGAARARRWYRAEAVRSAPALVAACWWPAPAARPRRLGALLFGVSGSYLALQLLHQVAQLAAALLLGTAGATTAGGLFIGCSLAAGVACAMAGGYLAARALPDAPLAGALTLAVACGALAVAGMLVSGGVMPLWYWGGLQLLALPVGAGLGGLVRARQQVR